MKVLFVCTGNTCRSCMAEAIFNNMCHEDFADAISAGLSVVQGSITSENAVILLKNNLNVDFSERMAVQLTEELLEESDYVFTMTSFMKEFLIHHLPQHENKIFTLTEFVGVEGDVVDPYGGDMVIYSKTFNDLENNISLLIAKLKEDRGIV